ncbi:unnamed protein product, partial [Sphacelaria rigidula]
MFWTESDSTVNRAPNSHHLLILMGANARTGENCKNIGGTRPGSQVNDSTSLLQFAGDNRLALVNTFFNQSQRKHVAY